MAIFYKSDVEKRLKALDDYYMKLRKNLEGHPPTKGYASAFGMDEESFVASRVSVNLNEVFIQLDHFKAEIAGIKALKTQAEKPMK